MTPRRFENLILALAMVAPVSAALLWIGEYWAGHNFPEPLQGLPYLHIFLTGCGFWIGVVVTDLADPHSSILRWLRARFSFCTLKFRTQFHWSTGQAVLVQLKFRKRTAGVTVRVARYGQNGWNGDQPHWSLLSEETLVEERPFRARSGRELVLSTRGLDPCAPVQFGSTEIPMDVLRVRPHQKITVIVSSKEHGTVMQSRIVNYHPYPLSFITTPDQLDVVIQDSAPVEP